MSAAVALDASEDKRVVMLIDLSSLFWSAWHASGEEEVSTARRRTIEAIHKCIGDNFQRLVAICCDSGRSFRKDIDEAYKANRPEKDLLVLGELAKVKEQLVNDGYLLWEAPGFEADDLIATACKLAVNAGHNVVIASADKDLLQLLALDGVKVLRTHTMKVVERKEFEYRFGIPPAAMGDWLALVGDSSDNIKGVPGVGEKTASALLTQHKTLAGIYDALEREPVTFKPSIARSLQQNADGVQLARQLVELRLDAPIDFDQLHATRTKKEPPPEAQDMDSPDLNYIDIPSNGVTQGPPPISDAPQPEQPPAAKPVASTAPTVIPAPPTALGPPLPFEMALEPTSLGVAFKLAHALWTSRMYSRFPGEEAIAAIIIRGREIGLPALVALDVFHFFEGKPAPHAHFIISRAEQHPDCEYFMLVESDDTKATYETKHRRQPRPTKHTYRIEDAVSAGLCRLEAEQRDWDAKDGKDRRGNWDKRRAEMLRKTCGVQLVRIVYPGAALGLYSYEELGGES